MDCLFLMGPTWTLFDYFRSFQIINTAFRSYSLNVLRGFEQAEVGHFSILSTVGIYLIRVWYTANVFMFSRIGFIWTLTKYWKAILTRTIFIYEPWASVTRWQDYFSIFVHLQQWKWAQWHSKFTKAVSKFSQMLKRPSKYCQRLQILQKIAKFGQIWSHCL